MLCAGRVSLACQDSHVHLVRPCMRLARANLNILWFTERAEKLWTIYNGARCELSSIMFGWRVSMAAPGAGVKLGHKQRNVPPSAQPWSAELLALVRCWSWEQEISRSHQASQKCKCHHSRYLFLTCYGCYGVMTHDVKLWYWRHLMAPSSLPLLILLHSSLQTMTPSDSHSPDVVGSWEWEHCRERHSGSWEWV